MPCTCIVLADLLSDANKGVRTAGQSELEQCLATVLYLPCIRCTGRSSTARAREETTCQCESGCVVVIRGRLLPPRCMRWLEAAASRAQCTGATLNSGIFR